MQPPSVRRTIPVHLTETEITAFDEAAERFSVSRHALMLAALKVGLPHLIEHPEELSAALPRLFYGRGRRRAVQP